MTETINHSVNSFAIMSSINIEYDDHYRRGCTLIWDSKRILSGGQKNGSKRKVYLIDGNFLQKSRVLSKIKYFESKDNGKKICKSTKKLRIQFDDKAPSTHEYQSEISALAQYLEENPHEKEQVVKEQVEIEQATLSLDVDNTESSDDVESPRDSSAMKSNTAIGTGGSGELSNYKSKIQLEEFQFGKSMQEPETAFTPAPEPEVSPEDLDLLPAEDESSINFTETGTSDMLF